MAIDVTWHDGDGYLPVELTGPWKELDAKRAIDDIRDEADKRGQRRLLIDMRSMSPPKTELTRFFTGEHAARRWRIPFKTAVVMNQETYNGFAETVAINRGAIFRVFFERDAALTWLCPDSSEATADDGLAG